MNLSRKEMMSVVFLVLLVVGWGCGNTNKAQAPLTRVGELPLYVVVPAGWSSMKLNPLQKDARNLSGLTYVDGGVHVGYGTPPKAGELTVRLQVIVIPKSRAEIFEKNKYPAGAVRRLEMPNHYVYTFIPKSDDTEAQQVAQTLQYKK